MGDYIRAGAGALICFAPLLLIEVVSVLIYILLAIGTVFTVFGLRTLLKHMSSVELSANGIRILGPRARAIAWWWKTSLKGPAGPRRCWRDGLRVPGTVAICSMRA